MMYRGVVEDNKDPQKSGRVRVRIQGIHTENNENSSEKFSYIKTSDLPWAEVMGGTEFGLIGGVGLTSILRQGTWVWVFLDAGNSNKPVVMGVINGGNKEKWLYSSGKGFCDPDGQFPVDDYIGSYDTNKKVQSKYPYNAVLETESGHIIEIDDSSGDERIKIHHKTGTQITLDAQGNLVIDVEKDESIHVKGNTVIRVDGWADVKSTQDMRIHSSANVMMKGSNIHFNPSFGFPEPALISAPMTVEANITPVPEDAAPAGYPASAEQYEGDIEYTELTSAECSSPVNPYDAADKAYALGSDAWRETGDNPNITALWDEIGYNGAQFSDETAWCAVFVAASLKRAGCKFIQTASSQAFANYGVEVGNYESLKYSLGLPISQGDIVVFYRNGVSSGLGHVGFATGAVTMDHIEEIEIDNPGVDYTTATCTIEGINGHGSGATADVILDNGSVVGFNITNQGSGYLDGAVITIDGDGGEEGAEIPDTDPVEYETTNTATAFVHCPLQTIDILGGNQSNRLKVSTYNMVPNDKWGLRTIRSAKTCDDSPLPTATVPTEASSPDSGQVT